MQFGIGISNTFLLIIIIIPKFNFNYKTLLVIFNKVFKKASFFNFFFDWGKVIVTFNSNQCGFYYIIISDLAFPEEGEKATLSSASSIAAVTN